MEQPNGTLKISELIQNSQPFTSTYSPNSPPIKFPIPLNPNPNPNSQILQPLNSPFPLIGTINSPSYNNSPCPNSTNCLLFSDGSSPSVCCDILDFNINLIGQKIKILSCNFIPFKFNNHKGAFLEIIKWDFLDNLVGNSSSLNSDSVSLGSDCLDNSLKGNCRVYGVLESISPVSVVSCNLGSKDSSNIRGFLVNVNVCECKLCKSKNVKLEGESHCYSKSVIVYFSGTASYWHVVISKLIGDSVMLLGLRKKLVYIGKDETQLMYVTTERSTLLVPKLGGRAVSCEKTVIKGEGECGVYIGLVKGVYFQGMLVELDNEVWLLLTDKSVTLPHSARVGAIICVRNVHFVNTKFSWMKMLILGSCVKTSINVQLFSPLGARCHISSQSQSMLGKFIEALSFPARMWVLLTISCFRKKLSGMLSEKDILGSRHSKGLAHTYTSSYLPTSVIRSRHGVFKEFCKHEISGCSSELKYDYLKLVLPISYFIRHSEETWLKISVLDEDMNPFSFLPHEARSRGQSVRRILSSKDIGIILVGSLQFSESSGRLQLVDGTGAIDCVIPDFTSVWSVNCIYEVDSYSLVMEGVPEQLDGSVLLKSEPFSCRSIFHSYPVVRNVDLAIYIYFHLRDASCKNRVIHPCVDWKDSLGLLGSGRFHLLRVTHKFPVQKFQGEAVISRRSSMFTEAIVLPWDLFLGGTDANTHAANVFKDEPEEPRKNIDTRGYLKRGSCKRYKINNTSSRDFSGLTSVSNGTGNGSCRPLNGGSSFNRNNGKQKSFNLSYLVEIPCSAIIRGVNNHKLATSGLLYCAKANEKSSVGCKQIIGKVLLEFKSDSYFKYQYLQIGNYYIIKHDKEEVFCNCINSERASGAKVLVTPETHLWSLSFLSDEFYADLLSEPPLTECSSSSYEVQSEGSHQVELLLPRSEARSLGIYSDVEIHLSANVLGLLELDLKGLGEGSMKIDGAPEEVGSVSVPACQLPQGKLMTLHGRVLSLHSSNGRSMNACSSHGSGHDFHHLQRVMGNVHVHVLLDHQIVKISGKRSNHTFPIGFGPGVDATFHRILSSGQNAFAWTPVSFIVVSSIRDVNQCTDKYSDLSSASVSHYDASFESIISNPLSDLIQCLDSKPMWLRCRVLAIHFLVFEKKDETHNDQESHICANPPVSIPLAGFVLDDGSSSCCCWANADTASRLLRLHEEISLKGVKNCWTGTDNSRRAAGHHVAKLVEKHGRITVKNFGSTYDSSIQDLNFSVSSANFFSSLDENILKIIVFNACFGSMWNVLGSVMKPDAVEQLSRHLTEMETTVPSMQNIWIQEVCFTNPLMEARNMVQELLCG